MCSEDYSEYFTLYTVHNEEAPYSSAPYPQSAGPVYENEGMKKSLYWNFPDYLTYYTEGNEENPYCHTNSYTVYPVTDQPANPVDAEEEMETARYWHCPQCLTFNTVEDEENPFCRTCGYPVCSATKQSANPVAEEEEMETVAYWHCPKCLTSNIMDNEECSFACTRCMHHVSDSSSPSDQQARTTGDGRITNLDTNTPPTNRKHRESYKAKATRSQLSANGSHASDLASPSCYQDSDGVIVIVDDEDEKHPTRSQLQANYHHISKLSSPSHKQASNSEDGCLKKQREGMVSMPLANHRRRRRRGDHEDEEEPTSRKLAVKKPPKIGSLELSCHSHQQVNASGNREHEEEVSSSQRSVQVLYKHRRGSLVTYKL